MSNLGIKAISGYPAGYQSDIRLSGQIFKVRPDTG